MLRTLDDIDLKGRKILVRADLNVPLFNGRITDDSRVAASARTIRDILQAGGQPIVMSHLGRPGGHPDPNLSLELVADRLSGILDGARVITATDCIGPTAHAAIDTAGPGEVVLLENLRFHPGEEENEPAFAELLAELGDIYVNDAFSASHREHASITGITKHLPSVAGRLLQHEVEQLEALLLEPQKPAMAIIGGAKVKDKLGVINGLSHRFDCIAAAGCVANTLLRARGVEIGASRHEETSLPVAEDVLTKIGTTGCELLLPVDAVLANALQGGEEGRVAGLQDITPDDMLVDLGPKSVANIEQRLLQSACVVWAGPPGAANHGFDDSTITLGRCIGELATHGKLRSVVGGGDTVAALHKAGLLEPFDHVSLAGGAFLEWLEKGDLPGMASLRNADITA